MDRHIRISKEAVVTLTDTPSYLINDKAEAKRLLIERQKAAMRTASKIINEALGVPDKPLSPSTTPGTTQQLPKQWPPEIMPWAMWGKNNTMPLDIIADCKKSVATQRALLTRTEYMYGNGIICYKMAYDADGNETKKPIQYQPWEDFKKANNIEKYLTSAFHNYDWFWINFPEIILSKDRTQIVKLNIINSKWCRFQTRDPNDNLIKNVYVSAAWPIPSAPEYLKTVPALSEDNPCDDLRNRSDSYKYILQHVKFPTLDSLYYPVTAWEAAREAGWVGISADVAKLKQSLFKNQFALKYHIEIATNFWELKMGEDNWKKLSPAERDAEQQITYDNINNYLRGVENFGKSINSLFYVDESTKKEVHTMIINVIDDKIKDGVYLPDSQQADAQIFTAVGTDMALTGNIQPGDSSNAGSGSDKREALLLLNAKSLIHRDLVLLPFYLIRDYNGWDPDIRFAIRDIVLQTLDVNPTGVKKVLA